MRASAAIFLLFAACTSFESAPPTPSTPSRDDAGEVAIPPQQDAGGNGAEAAPREACELVVEEPFDGRDLGAVWKAVAPVANSVIAANVKGTKGGPDPVMALGALTSAQPNGGALNAYVHRNDPRTSVSAVRLEYDLAYAAPPRPHALVGCTPGLLGGDDLEARVFLEAMGAGLLAVGTVDAKGEDLPGARATLPAETPPNTTWAHVLAEVALASDGGIERSLTVDGKRYALPRFVPTSRPVFDAVHVVCGIENAFAETNVQAQTAVFMKSLRVTACTR